MAEHLPFLIAAYGVVWVGVLLYVFSLAQRARHLEREIDELRTLVDARGSASRPDRPERTG